MCDAAKTAFESKNPVMYASSAYRDYTYQADKYMENLDKSADWKMTVESEEQTYFDVEYYYRKYVKV